MEKVIQNEFGFYSVKDMPTVDELSEYYGNKYFQEIKTGGGWVQSR